ncbi:hypothetical protein [Porphyrobacter sp. YT40]|uniref:hypothetical protein n=1 Tax=Porphyrobacter sp. YT40 TaxID=2547601 RepID=UPI0011449080|nr:hypothetical protein [Porphyrobacter sp. YT40]QDH34910.1 hypothetical protein E2E27_11590 [Porphyrobacter sp. YT40]
MKFIKLESRGGNYLVVASNVAWLRTAENGQTNVGIVGGQPLLVVGSVEEVAAKILAGTAEGEPDATPAPAQAAVPAPAPVAAPAPAPAPQAAPPPPPPPPPAPEPEPEPVVEVVEPEPEPEPEPGPVAAATPAMAPAPPARPRSGSARSAAQWERPASVPQPGSIKLKAGSQRMMGRFE